MFKFKCQKQTENTMALTKNDEKNTKVKTPVMFSTNARSGNLGHWQWTSIGILFETIFSIFFFLKK